MFLLIHARFIMVTLIQSIETLSHLWSNGLVVKALDFQSSGPCSKPPGGFKVDSAFHPSEVGIPGISGNLVVKVNCLLEVALALRQLNPIHKKGP